MSCTFDTQRYFTVNSPTVNENIIKSLQTVFYYVAFVFYLFEKSFWHIYSFICGCAGSLLLHVGFSLLVASRGCSSLHGLLTVVASLAVQHGLQAQGLQLLVAHGLSCPRECGYISSQARDWTCVPLHWQADSLPPRYQKSLCLLFLTQKILFM